MTVILTPSVLSTTEAHEYVGGKPVWDELEAVYGDKHLRPLRTLANGKQSWSREVIDGVLRKAQAEETLNDRPRVEAALAKRRAQREAQQGKVKAGEGKLTNCPASS
jgi:hypothetical protein